MSILGVAFTIGLGTGIGFYLQLPNARWEGIVILAVLHGGFAWLALTVGRMALDVFGLRARHR